MVGRSRALGKRGEVRDGLREEAYQVVREAYRRIIEEEDLNKG